MRVRPALIALAAAAPCLAWLHAIHMLAGHAWFANYGVLAAALPAAILSYAALARHGTRWVALGGTSGMLILFLVAEWLEGELVAGHRLSWPNIADHGWPLLLGAGLFLGAAMLVESARAMRLLARALDDT